MSILDRVFYHPDRQDRGSPDEHSLEFEDAYFENPDGTRLHGWFLPAETDRAAWGTVLHLHGNAANITGHYDFIRWMPGAGLNVLTFDYRGYGQSEGRVTREGTIADGAAAMDYLRSRGDVDQARIFVFGQSMGAAVAIVLTARRRDQVRALVAEGGFSGHREIVRHHVMHRPLLFVLAWWFPFLVRRGLDPIDFVGEISPVPVLFMHGTADRVVPVRMSRELHERAGAGRSLWLIDGMDHYEVWEEQAEEAQQRLIEFFRSAL